MKTSSAPAPGETPVELRDALRAAVAEAPQQTKIASAGGDASDHLLKMASDMANAEEQALTKQATMLGAAMCDGFMTRFAQFEEAAGNVSPSPQSMKTAAVQQHADVGLEMIKQAAADPAFEKFASENPDLVKEAFDMGYQQTMDGMVKQAEAEYEQGFNETMDTVHKVAAECYIKGETKVAHILRG